ncbi:MAG: FAD-dependent oxidoreductase [Micropruina sp.]|nr:FAD-dependent oxidoreductase [Micropruina sp.]
MSTGTRTDAIVVGAGCGGLVAAWQLAQSGCDVTLLDAWKWPGGLLAGAELGGLRVDVGAEGYSVRGGEVERLLHELGAAELIATPIPAGRLAADVDRGAPDPEAAGVRDACRPRRRGRPGGGGEGATRCAVGGVAGRGGPAGYGRRVLDDLVSPAGRRGLFDRPAPGALAELAPELAARVASGLSLREAVAASLRTSPPGGAVHGIRGGMNALVELLVSSARAASGAFELSCGEPVTGLQRESGRWRVTTSKRTLSAPIVVLALPLDAAVRLLGAPSLPQTTRIEVITLVLDAPGLDGDEPRGTGVLVGAEVPGVTAKALTHSSAKWAWLREQAQGRDYVRLSYGRRGQAPATAGLDEAELRRLVRPDAAALLGRPVPEPVAVRRTAWWILPLERPGWPAQSSG